MGISLLLHAVVAAGLMVSAYVHLDLASTYDGIGEQITVGDLFRSQGAVSLLAAVAVLVLRRRVAVGLAVAVALASTAAVVSSVYVRVPAVGPLPELYEPLWTADKAVSALGTTVATVVGAVLLRRRLGGAAS